VNGFVWGWPTIVLLLGTGVLLTVLTGTAQFRYLGFALREVLGKITQKSAGVGSVSPFAEIVVALHYREPDANGIMRGGAMYTLRRLSVRRRDS
jgi:AGCS family alanine or glycine:cation symporter